MQNVTPQMFYEVLNIPLSSIFKDHFEEFLDSSVKFLFVNFKYSATSQSAFTCSKLTIEKLEQGVKHVLAFLLLTLSR